jgi:hypothetical protein
MARKDWPTDPAEIQRSIEEAIQDCVRKGLLIDSGRKKWSQRTGRYEMGVYGFRQDVPLKGAHKNQ